MKILFFIESIAKHTPEYYTDEILMAEHFRRGHEVFATESRYISWDTGELHIQAYPYTLIPERLTLENHTLLSLRSFDFVYYRSMPPIASDVLFATYLLDNADIKFCNKPSAIRGLNEKIMALQFKEWIAPTIITSAMSDIESFGEKHGWPLILKPLDSYQSIGIQKVESLETCPQIDTLRLVQPFLISVETTGSKRVYILKGREVGAITFLPPEGDFRTNLEIVAYTAATVTNREAAACKAVGAFLEKHDVQFAALDFIDDYLMEINITCPGAIREFNIQYQTRLEKQIVDELLG